MRQNTRIDECLICGEEEPVCNCGQCLPICRTCATLALPRSLAHAVLADSTSGCSYSQLHLSLRDVQLGYWEAAAFLLHTQVPGHNHENEAEGGNDLQPGSSRGGLPPGPSAN